MSRNTLALLALLAIVTAREARAVDGVIEINHARALAGGITPGDAANYPVTLSQPGSYRLTGSLSSAASTSAIAITASKVTLDLNGFSITTATGAPGVEGIDATGQTDIRASDGLIEGFGGDGIVTGDRARIENVTVRANAGAGISVGAVSTVVGSTAHGNGTAGTGDGIYAGTANTVSGNTAVGNQGAGIHVLGSSTVSGNTVNSNVGRGLFIGEGSTVSENTTSYNGGDGITMDAGCTVYHNTVSHNSGDGIEVGGVSTIIGNTVSSNARCGVNVLGCAGVGCASGWSDNVLSSNNGSSTNRQAWSNSFFPYFASFNTSDTNFHSNVCSGGIGNLGDCYAGPQNNCP